MEPDNEAALALDLTDAVITIWECVHDQCREQGNHRLAASDEVAKRLDAAIATVRREERERCAERIHRWCSVCAGSARETCASVYHWVAVRLL